MSIKVCVLFCLVAAAMSLPTDPYGHQPVYEKKAPKPYVYSYGVQDKYRGLNFGQNEKSDGKQVHGSYTVQLPDGRKQTVNYKADHYNGFVAEVSYYGDAKYPSKSPHKPFIVKPTHSYKSPVHHQPPVYEPPHH